MKESEREIECADNDDPVIPAREPMERSSRGSYRGGRGRNEPRSLATKIKEGFRKTVAFLFGHVGICGLVVGYIIMGAFAFMAIEAEDESRSVEDVIKFREDTVQRLWRITYELNVLYRENWTEAVADEVRLFQEHVVQAVLDGYDGKNYNRSQEMNANSPSADSGAPGATGGNQWSFSGAFLYCLTVITTIGRAALGAIHFSVRPARSPQCCLRCISCCKKLIIQTIKLR